MFLRLLFMLLLLMIMCVVDVCFVGDGVAVDVDVASMCAVYDFYDLFVVV